MRRPTPPAFLAFAAAAALLGAAGCGKKKPIATIAPPPPDAAPRIVPKPEAPPPPLTPAQKIQIAADFDEARKKVMEARTYRLQGEEIERKDGREAANDTYVKARKLYRSAAQLTEPWVEPEAGNRVTQKQVEKDPELHTYAEERGSWIKEDISMGQKLNYR